MLTSEQALWMEKADALLLQAGFRCVYTSTKLPAKYYQHDDECNIVLRVTAVAMSSKNLGSQHNSAQVVSNVSVAETCIPRNNEVLQNRVLQAMGRYFLKRGMINARA